MAKVDGTLKVNGTGAVASPATAGVVTYTWSGTDTDTVGTYRAEWEVTISSKKQTFPNDRFLSVEVMAGLG